MNMVKISMILQLRHCLCCGFEGAMFIYDDKLPHCVCGSHDTVTMKEYKNILREKKLNRIIK